jgi:hypothetical protein
MEGKISVTSFSADLVMLYEDYFQQFLLCHLLIAISNKGCHAEILLKVVLNTITLTQIFW